MTQQILRFLLLGLVASLIGCGSKLPAMKPYKMEIQQGNVINSKMLMKLRPGMTKSQVRYILGTPLILDSFHPNRWDYFYELRKQGKVLNKRRVILNFQDNELVSVKGDVVPAAGDKVAEEDANVLKTPKSVAPPPQKETAWYDGLKFWEKDEEAVAAEEEEGFFSGLRFWEKDKKNETMERIGGLSDDDLAIIKDAESRGEGAVERSVDAAEKTMGASKSAAEKAAIAATTAASAAEKAANVAEATEENYTFPQSQAEATSEAAAEAGAVVAAEAEAEKAQSVLRKEVDLVPAVEVAEMAQSDVTTSEVAEQQVEQAADAAESVKTIAQDQADVKSVVNNWAEAWQSKNIDAYVASYVPTFRGKLRNRQSWLKQRDARIAKRKGEISVEIEDMDVVVDGNKATAYFYQKYRSSTYKDAVTKQVDFVKNKNTGEWLIWRETTIPKSKRPAVEKVVMPKAQQPVMDDAAAEDSLESQIERIGF